MAHATPDRRLDFPDLARLTPAVVQGRTRVLVMDSGVGGLHVCRHIARRLPYAGLLFCADSAAFPYGMREAFEVVGRVVRLAAALVARVRPDVVVVACNTASTVALEALRRRLRIPVVGVVPAIKPAAQRSVTRAIGLLGTPATIDRDYTREMIARFAGDCRVVPVGSNRLVTAAERKLRGQTVRQELVAAAVAPFFRSPPAGNDSSVDTVVLACTHFPWLRAELRRAAGWRVTWIDSGAAIASRVAQLTGGVAAPVDVRHCAVFTGRVPAGQSGDDGCRVKGFHRVICVEDNGDG